MVPAIIGAMSLNPFPAPQESSFVTPDWLLQILDRSCEGIVVESLDSHVLLFSKGAERIFGWSGDDVVNSKASETYRSEGFDVPLFDALEWGSSKGLITRTDRDGEKHFLDTKVSLLKDDGGLPAAFVIFFTDVTQQKSIEEQFYRAQRLDGIGTLAGGIAHDLNNLLQPIFFGLELLGASTTPDSAKILGDMTTSSRRCAALVRQLLLFTRGGPGDEMLFDIRMMLAELRTLAQSTFPKDIQFHVTAPENADSGWIQGDPTQVQQILINLCVNARDAMPNGGNLHIRASECSLGLEEVQTHGLERPGRFLKIAVQDDGCGITQENLDKLFTPFFTTKSIGQGTGLGLSTVMNIARNMGGFVAVESEVGKGTTFTVHLPAHTITEVSKDKEPDAAMAKTLDGNQGNGETILVIDDEHTVLSTTKRALEANGYAVIEAENGRVAVEIYKERADEIAMVVCDMAMPIMDGAKALTELRKINPKLRSVSASGLLTDDHADAKHYIAKPYTTSALLETVHSALTA
jgi:PAS domain S-box-containing protein